MRGYQEDISRAQNSIKRATGRRPQYFRAPFGFRSPLLAPALDALGLRFISWTRRGFDTRESNAARVFDRLIQGLKAGDILLLHDRGSALTKEGRPVCLVVLPRLLEAIKMQGLEAVPLNDAISPGLG